METAVKFVGQSSSFLDAVERASRAAPMGRPVLVVGERGTGKELIAEWLHRLSPRWGEPLVTLNCAAMPETLIESELFGHEAGAFTGAAKTRAGRFEQADGGTLFLDELGTLSMGAQERLLRAVEYGQVSRIGANRALRVDVRIVAATNDNLPALAARGRFRADLLDRLSFEVITLPPLRARDGDVPVLAEHFGRRMASEIGWGDWPGFSEGVAAKMEAYGWPGNVRELRNVVERAVYRWDNASAPIDEIIFDPFASPWQPAALPQASASDSAERFSEPAKPASAPETQAGAPGPNPLGPNPAPNPAAEPPAQTQPALPVADLPVADLRSAVDIYERNLLANALSANRWNQRQTAKALGLSYDQIRHAIRKHQLRAGAAADKADGI